MAVNINVPSQVKTYANLAAFPASGALKTIYIAEDTNKTYRWTGSVYVEVSAAGATGITIGTTAITSGTVGRVLFEGTGNVVQESANLFWDNTNGRLGIGGTPSTFNLDVVGIGRMRASSGSYVSPLTVENTGNASDAFKNVATFIGNRGNASNIDDNTNIGIWQKSAISNNYATVNFFNSGGYLASFFGGQFVNHGSGNNGNLIFGTTLSGSATVKMTLASSGNVLINTTTDAGFKLDVNGTARVQGLVTATLSNYNSTHTGNTTRGFYIVNSADSIVRAGIEYDGTNAFVQLAGRYNNGNPFFRQDGGNGNISFLRSGSEYGRIFGATGNWGINTTTDAGFKLDVNGTARVGSTLTVGSPAGSGLINICRTDNAVMTTISSPDVCIINNAQGSGVRLNTDNVTYLHVRGFASQFAANVTGTLTANAGFTRALLINNIINANANNNELAAIYINPTFNNNIYTGVKNIAIQSTIGGAHFNTTAVNDSAVLQADSTTKGFLPPRMTTTQKNAIATPATGLQIYDSTLNRPCFYDGTNWITL